MTDRLYIFTRNDLTPGYQLAQSCHAAVIMETHLMKSWDGYVIALGVKPEEIQDIYNWTQLLGHKPQAFYEPDLDNELTSFSVMVPDYDWLRLKKIPTALKKSTTFRGWVKGKLKSRYE